MAMLAFAACLAIAGAVFARVALDTGRVRIGSADELATYFDKIGYTAQTIRGAGAEVPAFRISRVPRGWDAGLTVS
ncbi:MAG: hypothetical protein JJ899_11295, partial [Alphaproteobacteria bacterium]|nr:hypothetical protein [Alphaproteobacteria bacterium]